MTSTTGSPSSARVLPCDIENNAWIGDSVIVCKGVTIGENSVIGAGSVVTSSIPANTIAAGSPARVIRPLDEDRKIKTRAEWYADPAALFEEIDRIDREKLGDNTYPRLDAVQSVSEQKAISLKKVKGERYKVIGRVRTLAFLTLGLMPLPCLRLLIL